MLTSTDIRIACEEHARFKYALLSQGWVGNGPGATYLPRQVSYVDAMRILLTDEPFDAKEALRINLINEVTPHDKLLSRAEEIADSIAKMPTPGCPHDERVRHTLQRHTRDGGVARADADEHAGHADEH